MTNDCKPGKGVLNRNFISVHDLWEIYNASGIHKLALGAAGLQASNVLHYQQNFNLEPI